METLRTELGQAYGSVKKKTAIPSGLGEFAVAFNRRDRGYPAGGLAPASSLSGKALKRPKK
jgi:hypothetical protein